MLTLKYLIHRNKGEKKEEKKTVFKHLLRRSDRMKSGLIRTTKNKRANSDLWVQGAWERAWVAGYLAKMRCDALLSDELSQSVSQHSISRPVSHQPDPSKSLLHMTMQHAWGSRYIMWADYQSSRLFAFWLTKKHMRPG